MDLPEEQVASNSSENVSFDYEEPCFYNLNSSMDTKVFPFVHSIICALGLVGNSLVIITYALYKRTKSMTDLYLLNVAIADLLFVLSLPLIVYNEMTSWSMGWVSCKLLRGSYSVNLYSGMLLLGCISIDRYFAIVQARRSFRLRSLSYSRLICAVIWVFAVLVSIPTFSFYHRYEPFHNSTFFLPNEGEDEPTEHHYVCDFKYDNRDLAPVFKMLIPGIQLGVGFFLPLFIMIFCYTSIIITLMKAKNFQRHKAVRVVLAVVVVFVICHLPYNISLLYHTISMSYEVNCQLADALKVTQTALQAVAYLHCCLNPVLYAFVGVKFRNHFRRIFTDLFCLSKKYMTQRRFSRVTSEMYMSSIRRSVEGSGDTNSSFTM
ncbi:C-C chemokine receptor type 6 [Oryzias melastigma]|uniref:C-C chemokine receptor type 6 n=1 Tax=Oryzias melastigma TaxID=30732 RepID=A0A3B3DCL4_ORYME|nr:C-C chemokine receptor type 6a [Oryzias melastigma]KAF6715248.1 C-C chemokine receptor type 6 [Oryzias melastigma]